MKGVLEEEIKQLQFKTIKIYQPPTLIRQDDLLRPTERRGIRILNTLNQFGILLSQKPLNVRLLAKKMINEVKKNTEGIFVYKPRDINL